MFFTTTREGQMLDSYLYYSRRQIKKAISILCQKDDLSEEDTQAIRELIEVTDRLRPQNINCTLDLRRETQMPSEEMHNPTRQKSQSPE